MVYMDLSRSELDIDLESGGNTTEEDESKDQRMRYIDYAKEFFSKEQTSSVGLNTKSLECTTSPDDASSSGPDTNENEIANVLEKKMANEKRRKPNSKNPSKPPLPPKGPSIGTADMKLVKEISELATLKRKRIERMKVLKRMKSKKASSCDINLCAMFFTVLFIFVIIFQGLLGSREYNFSCKELTFILGAPITARGALLMFKIARTYLQVLPVDSFWIQ